MFSKPDTGTVADFWRSRIVLPDVRPASTGPGAEEFALLAEYLPVLCWIAEADGAIFWYNKRWHDYCGTTPEEMQGWGWQSVHDPERLPEVVKRWTAAIETGEPFEMTFPLRGADGKYRMFLTRAAPVRDATGSVVRWLGTNIEVGEQVRLEIALEATEAKFETLTNAMPQMVWSTLPDGYHDYFNERWYEFTGVPYGSTDGEGWNDIFHPDDQDAAWERWRHSLATGQDYEIEYRLRHASGTYRWVLGRALPVRSPDGAITRWIGTCTDIDDAKRQVESAALLSQELSHRIKNMFAVISGLISLSGARHPDTKPVLAALSGRIAALGRAHDFARPHSPTSMPMVASGMLHGLLAELMAPYEGDESGRVLIIGEDTALDDRGATPIALVIHELATNSAKYGALSLETGVVSITTSVAGGTVMIEWNETGGPPVTGQPEQTGFGTQLADLSINRQLGGTIERHWLPTGLRVILTMETDRLRRG